MRSNGEKEEDASESRGTFSRFTRLGSGREHQILSSNRDQISDSGLVSKIQNPRLPCDSESEDLFNSYTSKQQEKRTKLKISFSQPNLQKISSNAFFKVNEESASNQRFINLYKNSHSTGKLKLEDDSSDGYSFKAEDLEDLGEIGRGSFGTLNKMKFNPTGHIMAVKRIRSTVNEKEQKELLMDLNVVVQSSDCPYIVKFFGAIFKEGDCWICMELMDVSTDKFYKFIYEECKERICESVIGKITLATVNALNYLKEKLKIIHRDVKPSNILLDKVGNIKLCDFGISGQLVDSIAKTRDAGCRPYMAPERIDPQRAKGYDVRSDVWSLGITLIELSTGKFPYPKWNSVFEQLQQVVHDTPPSIDSETAKLLTPEFIHFVKCCLIKEEMKRPKYGQLLEHPFIIRSQEESHQSVKEFIENFFLRWS